MKESLSTATKMLKRITLDDVYQEIDSKTSEIKKRQEEDFRYLNLRIDDLGKRIDSLGGRMDTVIQMLLDLSKQMLELSKQKC